jgi:hypothetical protein
MNRVRSRLPNWAALALVLMATWIAIGIVHGHPHDPSCQVCSALQFTSAELVATPILAAPVVVELSLTSAAPTYVVSTRHATPQGRAPPSA